jgi:hypothetical protein
LLRNLRDHFAKKNKCWLPCACIENPQPYILDCAQTARKALAMDSFAELGLAREPSNEEAVVPSSTEQRIRAEERERCAKIAEQSDYNPLAPEIFQGVEIAAAIRALQDGSAKP